MISQEDGDALKRACINAGHFGVPARLCSMDLKELGALFAAASDNGEKVSLLQLKSLINKVVHRRVSVRLRSMLVNTLHACVMIQSAYV